MKRRLLLTTLLFIFGVGIFELDAQKLYLWWQGGTQDSVVLSSVKTLTFASGNLSLNLNSGTTNSYGLSSVRKITFGNASSIVSSIAAVNSSSVFMYYNTAESSVYLNNIPLNNTSVSIYRVNGVLVMQTKVPAGNSSINVSGLNLGLYLLKVNNQVFKFIKQ